MRICWCFWLAGCFTVLAGTNPSRFTQFNMNIRDTEVLPPHGMVVKADQMVMLIHLRSDLDTPIARMDDLAKAVAHVTTAAENGGMIKAAIQERSCSLIQVKSKGSILSGVSKPSASYAVTDHAVIMLTVALDQVDANLFKASSRFNTFIEGLELQDTIVLRVTSLKTQVTDPNQYREKIVEKILGKAQKIKAAFGPNSKVLIFGLENSLQMIPISDTDYYLYIKYRFSLEL